MGFLAASLRLFFLLNFFIQSTGGWDSACQIRNCYCSGATAVDITCFVTAISPYESTFSVLPSNITSLHLSCTDTTKASDISKGILNKFSSLESLSIEECNISKFTSDSLRGLSELSNLTIRNCVAIKMEADSFRHLTQIQTLTIVSSKLVNLPNLFYLPKLQYLNVSNSNLQAISVETSGTFNYNGSNGAVLKNLKIIDASYNDLRSMPDTLLQASPGIEQLFLKSVGMTGLHITGDVELKNLTVLEATQNALEFVDFRRLARSHRLRELRLEGTNKSIQLDQLSHLSNIIEMLLTNFAITDPIWQELNSTTLARFDLTNNNLSTIDVSRLPTLRILVLALNKISNLNSTTFLNQPDMLLLNISGNNISSLPVGIFQNNANLKALDLGHNFITSLPSTILRGLRQLFYLDLSNNLISHLPDLIFNDTGSMLYLYLQSNKLQKLPLLSYMPKLNTLNISDNEIIILSITDLRGLSELQILLADNNNLTYLEPELLSECPHLLQAWFHNNQIVSVESLGNHPSLHFLRLDNNRLRDFTAESPFVRLKNLKFLFLDKNYFTSLKLNMFPASLQAIDLNRNGFVTLYSTSFQNLPQLVTVNLMLNTMVLSIPAYSVHSFHYHNPKPTFHIGFNTFLCDCNMGYLKVIAEDGYSLPIFNQYYPRFVGLENSNCYTPYEGGAIRHFTDVPLSHFVCAYKSTWCIAACSCCSELSTCECLLSCPLNCTCYFGGSGFKKMYIHIHCESRNFTRVPVNIPSRAVTLHLDGNNFQHLSRSDLGHLRYTQIIYLNGSGIISIETGSFDVINALEILRLEDNLLTTIVDNLFGNMTNLKQVYLHNNTIKYVSSNAFSQLSSIEVITLHDNRLIVLEAVPPNLSILSITLSGNPWACNCDLVSILLKTIHRLNDALMDRAEMCCVIYRSGNFIINYTDSKEFASSLLTAARVSTEEYSLHIHTGNATDPKGRLMAVEKQGKIPNVLDQNCFPLLQFVYNDLCIGRVFSASKSGDAIPSFVVALITLIVVLLITAVLTVVVLWKRREVQAWTYVKLGIRVFDEKAQIDKDDAGSKAFDAFISYSSKDDEFVASTLVPTLENRKRKYRLCVHSRDFPVGRNISETILRAIENSSRTILLLSPHFLQSEWCRFEFQAAHYHIIHEGAHRLIIVILGDISEDMLDPDLKVHLKSKTYLKFGDPYFWEKLYFALPDVKNRDDQDSVDISRGMRILAGDEEYNEAVKEGQDESRTDQERVNGQTKAPTNARNRAARNDNDNHYTGYLGHELAGEDRLHAVMFPLEDMD